MKSAFRGITKLGQRMIKENKNGQTVYHLKNGTLSEGDFETFMQTIAAASPHSKNPPPDTLNEPFAAFIKERGLLPFESEEELNHSIYKLENF